MDRNGSERRRAQQRTKPREEKRRPGRERGAATYMPTTPVEAQLARAGGVGGPLGLRARARHGSTRRRRAEPADLGEKAKIGSFIVHSIF